MMSRPASFQLDCRLSGFFYLGLAITGSLGFMVIRPDLFASGDPSLTLANLVEHPGLARTGVLLEVATATFQALAAVWLGRVFRAADAFAASTLTHFGMVNAIMVLGSAALLGAALDAATTSAGTGPTISHLLYMISGRFWQVCNVFFGLWLIPMGWLIWQARLGHGALGWVLIVGGGAYVLNAVVSVMVPDPNPWLGLLVLPATIGEFWMIGLLLWTGFRRSSHDVPAEAPA